MLRRYLPSSTLSLTLVSQPGTHRISRFQLRILLALPRSRSTLSLSLSILDRIPHAPGKQHILALTLILAQLRLGRNLLTSS